MSYLSWADEAGLGGGGMEQNGGGRLLSYTYWILNIFCEILL